MSILDKQYVITMSDGSKWGVPVSVIANDRATFYVTVTEQYDTLEESLADDTIPLFDEYPHEIHDWAANNMTWDDVKEFGMQLFEPNVDYYDGWTNGKYEIID